MREFFLGKLSHRISVQNLETNNNCQDASLPRMRRFLNQSLRANSFYSFFAIAHNELGKTTFCRRQNVAKPEVGSQRGEGFLAKRAKNRKQAIKDPTEASLPKLYEVAC